jgi:hypothetical protein
MATTEGLTIATISAMEGSAEASSSTMGAVQPGSMGTFELGGEESGVGELSVGNSEQLALNSRLKMMKRAIMGWLILANFTAILF